MTESHRITDVEHAKRFVFGGKSIFTLRSVRTGKHMTFKVKKPPADRQRDNRPAPFFVSVLDHADGQGGYTYLGMITGGRFEVTRKSPYAGQADAPPVTAAAWFFSKLTLGQITDQVELWHEGKCGRCGRKLTHPDSIATGLGPECAGKA